MPLPSRRASRLMAIAAIGAAFFWQGGAAQAQVKPFKIVGVGVGPNGVPLPGQPPRSHWAIGVATHLGLYCGEGTLVTLSVDPTSPPGHLTGTFGSNTPFTFAGANGDKLVCWYGRTEHGAATPGTFDLTVLSIRPDGSLVVQALWVAEFVAVPNKSTGKFAGVTGSWIMYAYSEPFVLGSTDPLDYAWQGQGWLNFAKKQ